MDVGNFLVFDSQLLLVGMCIWALFRGGAPERSGASLLLGGYLGKTFLAAIGYPINFSSPNIVHLAYTGALFYLSLSIAIHSNRIWPLYFSAFFLIELAGHLSVIIIGQGRIMAYWLITQMPIILQAIMLLIGTLAFARRARMGINAPDWRVKINA